MSHDPFLPIRRLEACFQLYISLQSLSPRRIARVGCPLPAVDAFEALDAFILDDPEGKLIYNSIHRISEYYKRLAFTEVAGSQ